MSGVLKDGTRAWVAHIVPVNVLNNVLKPKQIVDESEEMEVGEVAESPRRFDLELFIVHPTMVPMEVTSALGIEPQIVHGVGEPRRTPTGRSLAGSYPDTRWRFSVRYETRDQWFAMRIAELADRLMPHKEFFRNLRSSGGTARIIVQFLGDGYFGDDVSRDTLAKLLELELDLGIESFQVAPTLRE
jgi:hypothetical protein